MFDMNNNMRVIDSATTQTIGTKEDIELFNELRLALELMNDSKFNLIKSEINNSINFGISTPYPHGLPIEVGTLFYNANMNYDINIKEGSQCVYNIERYFEIKLRKN